MVGHSRDGNGRFRILSDGDTKPSQDLVMYGAATINEAQEERYQGEYLRKTSQVMIEQRSGMAVSELVSLQDRLRNLISLCLTTKAPS